MRRLQTFDGQQLERGDFDFLVSGFTISLNHRFIDFYDYGVLDGLTVEQSSEYPGKVKVGCGKAYDRNRERIHVLSDIDNIGYNGLSINAESGSYGVVINHEDIITRYGLDPMDGSSHAIWIDEGYEVNVIKQGVDNFPYAGLTLALISVDNAYGTMNFNYGQKKWYSYCIGDTFTFSCLIMSGFFKNYVVDNDPDTSGWGSNEAGIQWYNRSEGQLKLWNGSEKVIL